MDLSVCIIVKNEEANLRELIPILESQGAEIIVCDTGSSDGSVPFLEASKVKLQHFVWQDDFAAARNYSLSFATRKNILWLDADDRPSSEFWIGLEKHLQRDSFVQSAWSCVINSPTSQGGSEVFRQVRIFPNNSNVEFRGVIHEELRDSLNEQNIPVQKLDLEILHTGYVSETERQRKTQRNKFLLEKSYMESPQDPFVCMEYGNALYQSGEFSQALKVYQQGLTIQDKQGLSAAQQAFPLLIGNTLAKLSDIQSAVQYWQKSAQESPSLLNAPYQLGKYFLEKGQYDQAANWLQKVRDFSGEVGAIAEDRKSMQINSAGYLTLINMGLKNFAEAWESIEFILTNSPDQLPFEKSIVTECLTSLGRVSDAEFWLKNNFLPAKDVNSLSNNYGEKYTRADWQNALRDVIKNPQNQNYVQLLHEVSEQLGNQKFTQDRLSLEGISWERK